MMHSRLFASRHGSFSDHIEYYCGEEGAVGGQSMLKHKATESLLEEENYEGLKGDQGMVEHNHYKAKAHAWAFRRLPSVSRFFIKSLS